MFRVDKIFVSIASYRDPEVINTVKNIVDTCSNPSDLKIVVFEQNSDSDISCLSIAKEITNKGSELLVIKINHLQAKGPYYARAIIQQQYSSEEYFLQIDSHTRFVKDWDILLKHMLLLLPEPAVLTSYPLEYSLGSNKLNKNKTRTGLYIQGFGPIDRFTRIQSDIIDINHRRNYPYTNKAWAACFSFSKGSIVKDAPYDPKLEYLFFGEELDITLRLYTRGYYFYSPHIPIVYTLFNRDYRKTYWIDIPKSNRENQEKQTWDILRARINGADHGIYSLGKLRTLKEYEEFSDIASINDCKLNRNAKAFRRFTKRILLK